MGKLIYTDGAKSMTIQDSWDFVDAQAASQTKDGELYSRVAAAFRAPPLFSTTLGRVLDWPRISGGA